ncbi:molybdate ABC transporter permease subunit [Roseicyclus persicicus]|uniref:Molybdenum transport system permease n=1 Tax=Roseicyclus persicicus TaxID=2650661 RepID=A0A7X6K081_9RHOB|nr:molybdate ABC transporter permease subunit [Roseibacterium persicicum]NKX45985.1 molybdate ABC transporter permease subunit [Roseibacterium persicicum]
MFAPPSPAEWEILALSLRVGLLAVALALPPALLAAHALARWSFPGKALFNGLVHLPLVLPPVVTGYLLLLAFGPQAPLGQALDAVGLPIAFRWTGAAVAAAVMAFPLMVRAMRLSIEAVDPRLEQAAATLGAGRPAVVLTVTLPLALPGVVAGAILGFAKALGEFGATITFVSNIPGETRTLPLAVYAFLQVPGGEGAATRMVVLAVVLSMGALLVSEWVAARAARRVAGA